MKYKFLSQAVAAYEELASGFTHYDFVREEDEVKMRTEAVGPFTVFEYDTDEEHVRECPDYPHDCWREGCGTSWSTGGEKGVCLMDATGVTWRDAGVIIKGGLGF